MATPSAARDPKRHTAQVARGPFSYTDEGNGPTIVAVHGLPGSSRDYRWLGAALPPTVRLLRLDLPGFGGTPVITSPGTTIDQRAAFVVEALAALRIEQCVLLGHSMGGPVALAAASQAPSRVAALALLASVGLRPHRLLRRFVGRELFARAVDAPLMRGPTRAMLKAVFTAAGFSAKTRTDEVAHTVRCVAALSFGAQERHTAAVRMPTLCAWADDDAFIEREIFEEHAARLPVGPRLRWPTGGHNIQKTHAVELGGALAAFARSLSL